MVARHSRQGVAGEGKHTWKLTPNLSARRHHLRPARRARDDGAAAPTWRASAAARKGLSVWGVLRGDVDGFGVRLRRLHTIEEHVQVSVLYKQFFAGELEVLCSLPEFWKKVTILYSGGDDFAVYGAWDALLALARELQRLFHRFTEENLKEFPGPEAKTISMGWRWRPKRARFRSPPSTSRRRRNLDLAKSAGKDCIYVLGRVLEWKQLGERRGIEGPDRPHDGRGPLVPPVPVRAARDLRKDARRGTVGADPQLKKVWRFHRRLNIDPGAPGIASFRSRRRT